MNLCKRAQLFYISVILCFCVSSIVNAQPVPSIDLSYRAELVPAPPYRIGQQFKLRKIVTNLSTQFFTYAVIEPIQSIPPNVPPFDEITSFGGTTVCGICLSGQCFETPIILPQQTIVCEQGLRAENSSRNPVRLRAKVFHPFNIATDPNPSNDEFQVSIEILPEAIVSVPLSGWSYGLMSLLMISTGFLAARKT